MAERGPNYSRPCNILSLACLNNPLKCYNAVGRAQTRAGHLQRAQFCAL
jgi:hypothetical protein